MPWWCLFYMSMWTRNHQQQRVIVWTLSCPVDSYSWSQPLSCPIGITSTRAQRVCTFDLFHLRHHDTMANGTSFQRHWINYESYYILTVGHKTLNMDKFEYKNSVISILNLNLWEMNENYVFILRMWGKMSPMVIKSSFSPIHTFPICVQTAFNVGCVSWLRFSERK